MQAFNRQGLTSKTSRTKLMPIMASQCSHVFWWSCFWCGFSWVASGTAGKDKLPLSRVVCMVAITKRNGTGWNSLCTFQLANGTATIFNIGGSITRRLLLTCLGSVVQFRASWTQQAWSCSQAAGTRLSRTRLHGQTSNRSGSINNQL